MGLLAKGCLVVIAQLAKLRSNSTLYFAAPFTLFLWMNGAARQTIEALVRCGFCISFTSLFTLLDQLASRCVEQVIKIAKGPHILCYDHINISISLFVEQCSSAPAKVQSGTFPVVYEINNAHKKHMRLTPMLQHAQNATDLNFHADIRLTIEQWESISHQL